MHRRNFLISGSGLFITVAVGSSPIRGAQKATDRVGMGTVIFRNRFIQTKPKDAAEIKNPLTLLEVPAYYLGRFGVRNLEFWSHHFASLDTPYLAELRDRIKASGANLINVQLDGNYDLASTNEEERRRSLGNARKWIDAVAFLGSQAIRINPGKSGSSVEKSIDSMKELNAYCRTKGLPLLTENHFGLEMDPDIHLKIREAAGPENFYTLPDFGNYPVETMWESLAKILPYAYVVSAKAVDFDPNGGHLSYDFDRCVQLCERAGFKGTYLLEQWSRKEQEFDSEKIADWLLRRVYANI